MNFVTKNKKILLITGLVIVSIFAAVSLGLFVSSQNIENKVAQSKSELADIPDRTIDPVDNNEDESEINNDSEEFQDDDSESQSTDDVEIGDQTPDPVTTLSKPVVTPQPEPTPAPSPEPVTQTLLNSSFKSVGSYRTNGSVNVAQTGNSASLNFGSDFSFSGAPDAVVYLCKDKAPNSVSNCIVLGPLQSNSGSQSWSITPEEAAQYPNPIVWCRAFSVLMGHV